MPLFNSAPNSICVMRLSAIGDVCNAIAAVQAIQNQWPKTQITWITGKLEAQLIHDLPNIKVVIFDKKQGLRAYQRLWAELRGAQFDALLHMQYAFRASIATLGIKARYKLGYDTTRSQDFQNLFTNVKVKSPNTPHVLDGFMAFAECLGVKVSHIKWNIPYSERDGIWAQKTLSSTSRNLVIVPAASKSYKNWTVQGYAAIITYAQQQNWNVIVAGSPAENEVSLANSIEKSLNHPILNIVGKTSIKEMLALLDLTDLVIAPDTGPTHMANAMNTPVIGLYAHHNPDRTGPYLFQEYVVSVYEEALLAESGKTKEQASWRTRVKDDQAMKRIKESTVIDMLEKITSDYSL